ncbi:fibroblast growth factor 21 [Centroberyx gerrardi]|uniref:fibroblast growth factor 21 n=1 Tax=Centroberyx gerrardi TaxID=166262 RepID=UPI003AAB8256
MSMFPHTCFSFFSAFLFIIRLPFSLSFYIADSNPILALSDQVRERHLYTDNHRRGMYLEMTADGRVSGSAAQTLHSVLELRSVQPGQIVIKGLSSSLYLCVDSGGHLRGQSHYTEADCTFRELLLADGYTRFLSSHHGLPVSLASKHSPERHDLPFTRFLPLGNTLTVESVSEQLPRTQESFNMDSDDPLGMGLNSVVSPQFSMDK